MFGPRQPAYEYMQDDDLYFAYQHEQLRREQEREYRARQLAELAYQRELEAAELRRQLEMQRQRERQAEYRAYERRLNARMAARQYEEQAAFAAAAESARRRAQSKRQATPMSEFLFPQMSWDETPVQPDLGRNLRKPAHHLEKQTESRHAKARTSSAQASIVSDTPAESPARSPSMESSIVMADPVQSEEAATIIQNAYRKHRSVKALNALAKTLQDLSEGPQFAEAHQAIIVLSPSTDKYEPQLNKALAATEESLTRLLVQLDAIPSFGDRNVKAQRKQLVNRIQAILLALDMRKKSAIRTSNLPQMPLAQSTTTKTIVQVPIMETCDTAPSVLSKNAQPELPNGQNDMHAAVGQEELVEEWQAPFANSEELPAEYTVSTATPKHAQLPKSPFLDAPDGSTAKRQHTKRRNPPPSDKTSRKPSRKARKTRAHKRSPGFRKPQGKSEALHWFADMVSEALTSHQHDSAARQTHRRRPRSPVKHAASAC